jgi:hypothetical protein
MASIYLGDDPIELDLHLLRQFGLEVPEYLAILLKEGIG